MRRRQLADVASVKVYRLRSLLLWALVAVVSAVATAAGLGALLGDGRVGESAVPAPRLASAGAGLVCPHAVPQGRSFDAAWNTTALFITEVVLRRNPACGFGLSSKRLRALATKRAWANGRPPIKPFVTRYAPVAIADASPDPSVPQAIYVISRREGGLIVLGRNGRLEIPMAVGLAAPDAGARAFHLQLVLEDGSWRVDGWRRVAISSRDF